MWGALATVGNERLDPEPGSVGRGEVEPSLDVTAGRHWTHKVTAERRAETPARLEIGGIEEALTDATGARLGGHLGRLLAQTADQTGNCLISRRNIQAGMGLSNDQLAAPESLAKVFVYGSPGGYCSESPLMVLRVCVGSIERRAGARRQMAVRCHVNLLASGLGGRASVHDDTAAFVDPPSEEVT